MIRNIASNLERVSPGLYRYPLLNMVRECSQVLMLATDELAMWSLNLQSMLQAL